jgi:uncharacterized protein YkwD
MVFKEKDPVLSQLYEKEWRRGGGHACVPYGEHKLNEIKEREKYLTDKVMEALDKMKEVSIRKPTKYITPAYTPPPKHPSFVPFERPSKRLSRDIKTPRRIPTKPIIVIIILIIVGYVFYQNFGIILKLFSELYSTPIITPTITEPNVYTTEITTINLTKLEEEVHNLINEERAKYNLKALSWSNELADAARKHSVDMAENNYFKHEDLNGLSPGGRISNENIFWLICGENLYYSSQETKTLAKDAVTGWMNSPGHKRNIMEKYFDTEGIGVAKSSNGGYYISEDFTGMKLPPLMLNIFTESYEFNNVTFKEGIKLTIENLQTYSIKNGTYLFSTWSMDTGDELEIELNASYNINFFIFNKNSFENFRNNNLSKRTLISYSSCSGTNLKSTNCIFSAPSAGDWSIVIDNTQDIRNSLNVGKEDSTIDIKALKYSRSFYMHGL